MCLCLCRWTREHYRVISGYMVGRDRPTLVYRLNLHLSVRDDAQKAGRSGG